MVEGVDVGINFGGAKECLHAAAIMGVPGATGTAQDFVFGGPAHRYLVQLAIEQAQGPSSGEVAASGDVAVFQYGLEVQAAGFFPHEFAALVF